ncbi:hypothetical protein Bca4012_037448 [Brassica carinata]
MEEESDVERLLLIRHACLSIKFNVAEWLGAGKVNGKNDSHNVSKLHIKHAKKFAANVWKDQKQIFINPGVREVSESGFPFLDFHRYMRLSTSFFSFDVIHSSHYSLASYSSWQANLELSLSCVQTQLTPYTELEEKELMHFLEKAVQEISQRKLDISHEQ